MPYDIAYFKDDHNRILRVAVGKMGGQIELHVLQTFGEEKRWVPLPDVDGLRVRGSSIEAPTAYPDLVRQARNCSLFQKR